MLNAYTNIAEKALAYGFHCFNRGATHFKAAWSTNKGERTIASSLIKNSTKLITNIETALATNKPANKARSGSHNS